METSTSARKLRVLTLIDVLSAYGGAESLALEVVKRLDRDRFEPTLCATRLGVSMDEPAKVKELQAAGVAFLEVRRRSRRDLLAWRTLVARIRRGEFDVLHSHKFGSNAWASLFARWPCVPVFVAHEHGSSFDGRPVRRWFDRQVIGRRADAFIAVSEDDRRRIVDVVGVPEEKVRLVPNGIAALPPPSTDVRRELGIPRDAPVIGTLANFRREKALDVVVEAVADLRAEFPAIRLLLAGGSRAPEGDALESLVAKLELSEAVRFLGLRSDISNVLAAFDVGVLCSEREASPLSVMEYMDAGLPVVATRVGGVSEIVIDGETGLLVPPRDRDRLATAIATLLRDPERARRMGEAGRERRRARFTIESTARRIGELYEALHVHRGGRT